MCEKNEDIFLQNFCFKGYHLCFVLLVPETEKFDIKNFLNDIEDRKEEGRIQEKIYQKISPPGDPCSRYYHIREHISDDYCAEDAYKKQCPFFYRCIVHA